jgi:hypothetical protein
MLVKDESLRELMDETVIGSDPESLRNEFEGHYIYPKFRGLLSEADFLVKFPMYLFDWYAYCQEIMRHLTENKSE